MIACGLLELRLEVVPGGLELPFARREFLVPVRELALLLEQVPVQPEDLRRPRLERRLLLSEHLVGFEEPCQHRPDHDRGHRGRRQRNGPGRVAARPLARAAEGSRRLRQDRLVGEPSPEVGGELGHRRVPALPFLLEGLAADDGQLGGQPGADLPQIGRLLVEDLLGDLVGGVALEGSPEAEELVEHHPQAEDVGAPVESLPASEDLLGAHVAVRAADVARRGELAVLRQPRESEVRQLRPVLGREQHVQGLHVPVDDARPVGELEGGRELRDPGRHPGVVALGGPGGPRGPLLALLLQPVEEGSTFRHELLGDPVRAVVLAVGVDRHDRGVCQPTSGAGLAVEQCERLEGHPIRQDQLERDPPAQGLLFGLPDRALTPLAEQLDQPELADPVAGLVVQHASRSGRARRAAHGTNRSVPVRPGLPKVRLASGVPFDPVLQFARVPAVEGLQEFVDDAVSGGFPTRPAGPARSGGRRVLPPALGGGFSIAHVGSRAVGRGADPDGRPRAVRWVLLPSERLASGHATRTGVHAGAPAGIQGWTWSRTAPLVL